MNTQKIFIIIALGITIFLLWNAWIVKDNIDANGNKIEQTTTTIEQESQNDIANTITNVDDIPNTITDTNDTQYSAEQQIQDDDFTTITTDLLTVEISHTGGTIQSVYLNKYNQDLDSNNKLQLISNEPGKILQAKSGLYPANEKFPNENTKYQSKRKNYALGDSAELIVPFTWSDNNGITITKKYIFKADSYLIKVEYDITNNSGAIKKVGTYTKLVRNAINKSGSFFIAQSFSGGAFYIQNDEENGIFEKIKFDEFNEQADIKSTNGWAAMLQQYFLTTWIPNIDDTSTYKANKENGLYKLTIINPYYVIKDGERKTIGGDRLYVGPKEHARINDLAEGMDKTADYSFFYIFAKPLATFLHWIYSFIQSWGLSIIIITIIIKLIFYKLTEKSYRSMAAMRKLTPRLSKIRETYKGDKQKIGRKTMELYKQEKVSPASGCIPILVQIPVFIAMYWVLREMVELRHTPFLYISDLSAKDPYFIMPIIMGISMWLQQRLNPPPTDPMQAKIMSFLPIFFTVFFLFFPAGLVLYWLVNNVISIAQQMLINKSYDKKKGSA